MSINYQDDNGHKKIYKQFYHFKDNVRMISVSFAIYSLKNMTNGKPFH